jgi:hypothetical protein
MVGIAVVRFGVLGAMTFTVVHKVPHARQQLVARLSYKAFGVRAEGLDPRVAQ